MFGFPVPVSNQSIPRGWFAALVRFMNSLLLRGDGRYFAVTHTTEGTTIKPTPALIQALEHSGGAAPTAGGGTTYGLEATIDGSTASIALVEGGTASSISLIPTAPVTLTAGANGELIIGSTVSGGGFGPPDFSATPIEIQGNTPVVTTSNCWLWGDVSLGGSNILSGSVTLILNVTGSSVTKTLIEDTGRYALSNPYNYFTVGICEAIPSGATVTVIEHSPGKINTLKLYPSL